MKTVINVLILFYNIFIEFSLNLILILRVKCLFFTCGHLKYSINLIVVKVKNDLFSPFYIKTSNKY